MTTIGSALDPIDDNRVEQNENVQLTATITAGIGAFTPNGNTANVIIQDNDGTKFVIIIIAELDIIVIILLLLFQQSSQLDFSRPYTKSLRQWV